MNSCNTINITELMESDADAIGRGSAVNNELDFSLSIVGNSIANLPLERYIWEMETCSSNITPSSTVLNSPDLNTEMQYSLHANRQYEQRHQKQYRQQCHRQHHYNQIHVGHSPGSQFNNEHEPSPQDMASTGSPTDVDKYLRDGEIVIFDDIDKVTYNNTCPSDVEKQYGQAHYHSNEDVLKTAKMIGQLPIAEYEGSPRKFGTQTTATAADLAATTAGSATVTRNCNVVDTPTSFPKRAPGYPRRVSSSQHQSIPYYTSSTNSHTIQNSNNNCNNINDNNKSDDLIHNVANSVDETEIYDSTQQTSEIVEIAPVAVAITDTVTLSTKKISTFDYLHEFSKTHKVLEEFFRTNPYDEKHSVNFIENGDDAASSHNVKLNYEARLCDEKSYIDRTYIGQRLAKISKDELCSMHCSPKKQLFKSNMFYNEYNDVELFIDSNSRSSGDMAETELETNLCHHSRNFTLSPETTDYDSNCGNLDSLSNDINSAMDYSKLYTSMPVLEDGLSSGHNSDTENSGSVVSSKQKHPKSIGIYENNGNEKKDLCVSELKQEQTQQNPSNLVNNDYVISNSQNLMPDYGVVGDNSNGCVMPSTPPPVSESHFPLCNNFIAQQHQVSEEPAIEEAMKEIRLALQRAKIQPEKFKFGGEMLPPESGSPIWVLRKNSNRTTIVSETTTNTTLGVTHQISNSLITQCSRYNSKGSTLADGEELDTDLETDCLLGQYSNDEQNYSDGKSTWPNMSHISGLNVSKQSPTQPLPTNIPSNYNNSESNAATATGHNNSSTISANDLISSNNFKLQTLSASTIRQNVGTSLNKNSPEKCEIVGKVDHSFISPEKLQFCKSPKRFTKSLKDVALVDKKVMAKNKEGFLDPKVLIEGVLFRARYLGSTQLVCEGQPTKSTRMMQAEEAVSRIKASEGESQPYAEVDLFISTEKIMVLNTILKEIMMDHTLRSISYIADIGDLVVLMARRQFVPYANSCAVTSIYLDGVSSPDGNLDIDVNTYARGNTKEKFSKVNRVPKMICHVFESDDAQFIAQSIGQAFQVAYMEFLKANGIENESLAKEMDYQEVLNSQEIFGDELEIFARKELQKEVVLPKAKGEILGVVIVESGWGSMLPTVVIANLMSGGAAARCGLLNIGDQLIAINGMSLVGLPLSTCQSYIRNAKNQTAVKFTVVPCPPVVEVKILRPKALFQLGFSVQNGVICSLLRGGIAERGGVRVGHRIIEINNQSVVAVPHDTIVKLLSSSVGEILMKTMPTSMFRLLTGQETPIYI